MHRRTGKLICVVTAETLIEAPSSQFAYLQLGTVITTVIRNIEMKLEGPFPQHNYHASYLFLTNTSCC
jgi:hypothetical protein